MAKLARRAGCAKCTSIQDNPQEQGGADGHCAKRGLGAAVVRRENHAAKQTGSADGIVNSPSSASPSQIE